VLADVGETAQFLAAKGLALTNAARDLFLDNLYPDLAAALRRLIREAKGDYGPDRYVQRFPKSTDTSDSGITPWALFEAWVNARQAAQGTVESWRYVFDGLRAQFAERSAGSILPEEADAWIKGLITKKRTAGTVKKTWLTASKTVFRWGVKSKLIPRNPFEDVSVTVPKHKRNRPKSFYPEETKTILGAAAAIRDCESPDEAAKRWLPWLCAYTGSRPGEITQLRKQDVVQRDGIYAIHITPEAGTVKSCLERIVPIHDHLIDQGFVTFVSQLKREPLFYRPREKNGAPDPDPIKQKKSPAAQARQRVADWVGSLGMDLRGVSPNHAWRHTFKRIGRRAEIDNVTLDAICGHAPSSEGDKYGEPSLEDMALKLRKFPRYAVCA
jgi:integrase